MCLNDTRNGSLCKKGQSLCTASEGYDFKTLFPTFLLNLMSFKLMCLSGCNSQISGLDRTEVCV